MLPLAASLDRQSTVTLENLIVAGSWGDAIRIVHIVVVQIPRTVHIEHIRIITIEIVRRQRPRLSTNQGIQANTDRINNLVPLKYNIF